MLVRLKALMKELCQKWQCEYTESNGEPDHFHLVFRYYPQLQLSKFIDNIKSVSSRRLNQEYDNYLRKIYPPSINTKTGKESRVFWNESYAINSVGGAKLDDLIKYVQNQPKELLELVTSEAGVGRLRPSDDPPYIPTLKWRGVLGHPEMYPRHLERGAYGEDANAL